MTISELIKVLTGLSNAGYGNVPVLLEDGSSDVLKVVMHVVADPDDDSWVQIDASS